LSATIRLASPADAPAVQAIYAPVVAGTPISLELEPPAAAEMAQRIERLVASGFPWLVLERAGAIAGYAYGSRHRERAGYRWSVEVSVYVAEAQRRHGIARALYTSLFAVLALQGYCNAYAGITLPNPASVRLHERLGFTPVGVFERIGFKAGAWHDVAWYVKDLRPGTAAPSEPRTVHELAVTDAWPRALAAGIALLRD
jgi:phosphinothricin acetyltransferase